MFEKVLGADKSCLREVWLDRDSVYSTAHPLCPDGNKKLRN